mmetsp:Transcript_88170/g.248076  ORF Transcript_88170/g.248076 Transcript_88170/m.248076 type:complete len:254 (-) Transcript_88170:462-1223(-)
MHFKKNSSISLFFEYVAARLACSIRTLCCSRTMDSFRCCIASWYRSSASLPRTLLFKAAEAPDGERANPKPVATCGAAWSSADLRPAPLVDGSAAVDPVSDAVGPLVQGSGVCDREYALAFRSAEAVAPTLAGRRLSSARGGCVPDGDASVRRSLVAEPCSARALVTISALYLEERARSAAALRILFCRFAPLIWSSKNRRSSSRASAFCFHLSTSFLYPLQRSSSRMASVTNQSSSPSRALIVVSSFVFASS